MNNMELQLWRNLELVAEQDTERDYMFELESLRNRRTLVRHLDERLGTLLQDLVSGPLLQCGNTTLWRAPIEFYGVTGYIEGIPNDERMNIKFGTGYAMIGTSGLKTASEIADWIAMYAKASK
jgi:hypothetical protein